MGRWRLHPGRAAGQRAAWRRQGPPGHGAGDLPGAQARTGGAGSAVAWRRIRTPREHSPRCAGTSGRPARGRTGRGRPVVGKRGTGEGRQKQPGGFQSGQGPQQGCFCAGTRQPPGNQSRGGGAGGRERGVAGEDWQEGQGLPRPLHCLRRWSMAIVFGFRPWTPLLPGPWFPGSSQACPPAIPHGGCGLDLGLRPGWQQRQGEGEDGEGGEGSQREGHPWARLELRPASPSGPRGCTRSEREGEGGGDGPSSWPHPGQEPPRPRERAGQTLPAHKARPAARCNASQMRAGCSPPPSRGPAAASEKAKAGGVPEEGPGHARLRRKVSQAGVPPPPPPTLGMETQCVLGPRCS